MSEVAAVDDVAEALSEGASDGLAESWFSSDVLVHLFDLERGEDSHNFSLVSWGRWDICILVVEVSDDLVLSCIFHLGVLLVGWLLLLAGGDGLVAWS